MVVEKILKQLTPERVKKEIAAIQRIKLPPELQKWVKEYEKVGERNDFIWKWLYKIIQIISLSSVSEKYKESLVNNKFLLSMSIFLLDDVVDKEKNKKLLDKLLKIFFEQSYIKFSQLNKVEKEYLKFLTKIWDNIKNDIKKYPRFEQFKDIFYYDIIQVLNAMKYAYLVNKNLHLINKTEYWLYFPNSMQGMAYSTLDLMCSPKFNIQELNITRETICQIQKMVRIGNWISSWEREINDSDFTSGVFAYAIENHVISVKDLQKDKKKDIITKIKKSKIEKNLLEEWEDNYWRINKIAMEIKTINIKTLLLGLQKLLFLELINKRDK